MRFKQYLSKARGAYIYNYNPGEELASDDILFYSTTGSHIFLKLFGN